MVQSIEQAKKEVAAQMREYAAEIEKRIEGLKGVMMGQNSVVRASPGLYLVPKDGGYGVAGILQGVVMWSPIDAKKMAEHCRKFPGSEAAQAVFFADALRAELEEVLKLAEHYDPVPA